MNFGIHAYAWTNECIIQFKVAKTGSARIPESIKWRERWREGQWKGGKLYAKNVLNTIYKFGDLIV